MTHFCLFSQLGRGVRFGKSHEIDLEFFTDTWFVFVYVHHQCSLPLNATKCIKRLVYELSDQCQCAANLWIVSKKPPEMQTGQLSSWGAHFPLSPAIIRVSGNRTCISTKALKYGRCPVFNALPTRLRRRSNIIPVDGGSVPAHIRLKRPTMWPICDIRYASKHKLLFLYVFQRTKASQDIPPSV